ncbi:GtrA family protein [Novosphingobium guangzhouense]|uniref:Polysaccharide synthesis protein GtrA n=1 Tax=Novosphingobium guangzhouense TaxID=1850347 RepID=A0A2K2FXY6_9SPHN|nr:GtrA family protein [Novosphingobium guangzhouense]PNU03604.1 polysaccharide synthesis protein GtrA [Novosphingobium guangzhouense]
MFHSPIVPAHARTHYGLFSRHTAVLFARNAVTSSLCFAIDMGLIWLMVSQLGIDKFVAVTAGFLIANSLNYGFARIWVFRESDRGFFTGYVYYLTNALVGLAVILGGFALMTEVFDAHYLVARVIVSLCSGTLVFLLNLTLNFHEV